MNSVMLLVQRCGHTLPIDPSGPGLPSDRSCAARMFVSREHLGIDPEARQAVALRRDRRTVASAMPRRTRR